MMYGLDFNPYLSRAVAGVFEENDCCQMLDRLIDKPTPETFAKMQAIFDRNTERKRNRYYSQSNCTLLKRLVGMAILGGVGWWMEYPETLILLVGLGGAAVASKMSADHRFRVESFKDPRIAYVDQVASELCNYWREQWKIYRDILKVKRQAPASVCVTLKLNEERTQLNTRLQAARMGGQAASLDSEIETFRTNAIQAVVEGIKGLRDDLKQKPKSESTTASSEGTPPRSPPNKNRCNVQWASPLTPQKSAPSSL